MGKSLLITRIFLLDGYVSLYNAEQSSTYIRYKCLGNRCTAKNAIDRDKHSMAVTTGSKFAWWSVQLASVVRIKTILVSTETYALRVNYFRRFKVETKVLLSEPWKVCKREYSLQGSPKLHMVQCENVTLAGYLRLSVAGAIVSLYLYEVQVIGSPTGKR